MLAYIKNSQLLLSTKFAIRELRNGIIGFRIFIACLILGVGTIAGVGTLSESIEAGLKRDGKQLLGGDISLRLLHTPAKKQHLEYFAATSNFSEVIEMRAMAKNTVGIKSRTLVELKAVDNAYPLVGKLILKTKIHLSSALANKNGLWGVVADENLLNKLNLKIGDLVEIGDSKFRLAGIIKKEPDRVANIFSLGPRLMILKSGLEATNLIQPGSQIRYRYRILLENAINPTAWLKTLKKKFPEMGWQIRNGEEPTPGLKRFIDRMTLFLSFVGLTTLLIGGTGVFNAVTSYLDSKIKIIATYKCLGAQNSFIFQVYFIQVALIASLGTFIGLIFGSLVPVIANNIFSDIWPVSPENDFYPIPIIMACVFSFLITTTFTLWPIAKAQNIPAANLFRNLVQPSKTRPDAKYIISIIIGAFFLAGLTIIASDDRWFSIWFIVGALITLILLKISATGLIYLTAKVKNIQTTELRLALSNLSRPGANSSNIIISLGLGLTVLITINLIEGNLNRQIDDRLPQMAPTFFFIDIQSNQISNFDKTIKSFSGIGELRRVATLRGRIVKINEILAENVDISADVKWAVRGDRVLTYASKLPKGAQIVAGKWWPANYRGLPLISLDANIAKGFGVSVGDTLTLNILGRDIKAKIASLRKINWRSLRFDFAIIFAPGTLESAPQSHIAALQTPKNIEAKVEEIIGERFNNISIIKVREALQAAATILDGIGTAIRSTAAITILAGSLVLAGAVAAGRRRRIYESVIYKVLGANRGTILRSFLIEYGLLGIATALVSGVIGTIAAWSILVFLMNVNWIFIPSMVLTTIFSCLAITIFIGFFGTWRALGQKASPILRNE